MRKSDPFDDQPWWLISVKPGMEASSRRWNRVIIWSLAFVVASVFAMTLTPQPGHAAFAGHKISLKIDGNPSPVSLAEFKNGYAPVIGPALPAVVNISSTKVVKQNNTPGLFFNDPLFRQFFGDQFDQQHATPQTEREYSLGSGVIVNPDGYILTNNHVVAGASDIEVSTQGKQKFRATVVGTDPQTDIAVLKVNATKLPSLTLGDSSNLKVGDVVFAVGDPFGIGETATMGIVSATGRGLGGAIERYEDFIQTDAAINPGNSGGALLDLHGDLVGINTAIITGGSGGNQGVGFAIPMNMARHVMELIVDHGKVIRGHLGVAIQRVSPEMAKAFGLGQGGGALVAEVTQGSPAAKAGIKRGDIILEMNGQPVNEPDDLSVRVAETPPGTTVDLKISHSGEMRDVTVTLGELSERNEASTSTAGGGASLQGVQVQSLTPSIARELGISTDVSGVVITSVDPSSPAAAAGLERGDVIQEVNRKAVRSPEEYHKTLAETRGKAVLLLVNRGGSTHFVIVEPR